MQVVFNAFHFYVFILVLLAVSFLPSLTRAWGFRQLAGERRSQNSSCVCAPAWLLGLARTFVGFFFFFFPRICTTP